LALGSTFIPVCSMGGTCSRCGLPTTWQGAEACTQQLRSCLQVLLPSMRLGHGEDGVLWGVRTQRTTEPRHPSAVAWVEGLVFVCLAPLPGGIWCPEPDGRGPKGWAIQPGVGGGPKCPFSHLQLWVTGCGHLLPVWRYFLPTAHCVACITHAPSPCLLAACGVFSPLSTRCDSRKVTLPLEQSPVHHFTCIQAFAG
jgi:hypothetical protein